MQRMRQEFGQRASQPNLPKVSVVEKLNRDIKHISRAVDKHLNPYAKRQKILPLCLKPEEKKSFFTHKGNQPVSARYSEAGQLKEDMGEVLTNTSKIPFGRQSMVLLN